MYFLATNHVQGIIWDLISIVSYILCSAVVLSYLSSGFSVRCHVNFIVFGPKIDYLIYTCSYLELKLNSHLLAHMCFLF